MITINRRRFLGSLAAAISAPSLGAATRSTDRLPIAFSTLGCPKWDWETILKRGSEWGYAAIEVRGIQGDMDLVKRAEFSPSRLAGSLKDLEALDLKICGLGASARMHEPKESTRKAQLDEGRRFIDLAHRLRAPYVRVFGDKLVPAEPREATVARIISGLRELGEHAKGSGVTVLIESHGDFCDSPTLREILKGAAMPTVGLLWDAHHTCVVGRETPDVTVSQLGDSIRHTHLKDSKPAGKEVRYVLTGEGAVPVRETVRQLVKRRYGGLFSFEWEKGWHPEIEDPEIAFPHFAKAIRTYLLDAGYKAG